MSATSRTVSEPDISLFSYVAEEKLAIASKYLIPQIEELTGLNSEHVTLSEAALNSLNKSYCRESGVRNLRKHIEKIYRKVAFKVEHFCCLVENRE